MEDSTLSGMRPYDEDDLDNYHYNSWDEESKEDQDREDEYLSEARTSDDDVVLVQEDADSSESTEGSRGSNAGNNAASDSDDDYEFKDPFEQERESVEALEDEELED